MPDVAIAVEGLSKSYIVGHQSTGAGQYTALRDVIARNARSFVRKTRDMMRGNAIVQGDEMEEFWALKDVSFKVRAGDRVGIIGRNGAGKSTLLKILSRITEPTKGRVEIAGRVASLLEVGTGFHSELNGRENIYLNGAILGMAKGEIRRKFDEIVAFAEVEKFLDTPVKRYSSGMYVRLAFAVAAHLEPDILIVDEVLAVGDAQFQKKCMGKIQDVGKEGRTVLFVSHNMAMISSLCETTIYLQNGGVREYGPTSRVILKYAAASQNSASEAPDCDSRRIVGDSYARLLAGGICDLNGAPLIEVEIGDMFKIFMEYRISVDADRRFIPNFHFHRADGSCAFVVSAPNVGVLKPGDYRSECHVPGNFLNDGLYSVKLALSSFESGVDVHFSQDGAVLFNIRDPIDGVATRVGYNGPIPGAIRPLLPWTINPLHGDNLP
ncbi:MAG: ABC transporter ATP-binding protein [Burkholderiales bacterium]|nr:ABC transporter ATP-binding protein [Burkholderiales bacterium]